MTTDRSADDPRFDDGPRRPLVLDHPVTTRELAARMEVPATDAIRVAFEELGRLITVPERLAWELVVPLAAAFEFDARRGDGYAEGADDEDEGGTGPRGG